MNDEVRQELSSLMDERAVLAAMLRQEAALAQAQTELGLMSVGEAQSILNTCKVDLFDVPHILRDSLLASNTAEPPLIKHLRESVCLFNPAAAKAVYRIGQSADLLCNALALVTRDVLDQMGQDMLRLQDHTRSADVSRAWQRVQAAANGALRLQFEASDASPSWPMADVAQLAAHSLGLSPTLGEGPEDWMALGCELGVFTLCVQRVATDPQAVHAPLWVAQWLTELSTHTHRPADARDFWRAQWPLWSTLALNAAQSLRALTASGQA